MNTEIQEVQLNTYPAYKDSGVEWLGEIPEHWEVKRLGTIITPVSLKNYPRETLLSITREKGVIIRDIENEDENHNFIPEDLTGYKLLKRGQFGMNKMKAWQGSYGVSDFNGIVSPAYYTFEFTKEINSRFFHLAIRSKLYVSYFGQASDGVRIGQWDLSKERMKQIPFVTPPLYEQAAIANFLDDKCAKIDAAVEIKQQQIELLKERRQIAIHQAVTQGLDPSVPMKDSGIEWIGKIPEHWEVKRFKHLYADTFSGGTPSTEVLSFWDGGISWVSSVDVKMAYLSETSRNISELGLVRSSAKIAPKGSVIIVTRSGILQHTLPIAILMKSMAINQDVKCFVVREKLLSPDYLLSYIQGKNNEILVETRKQGATVESIEMEDFSNMIIPLPELNEQFLIVEHIKKMTSKIDSAISIYEQEIEKLKEYKTILINSAVTGKIMVNC